MSLLEFHGYLQRLETLCTPLSSRVSNLVLKFAGSVFFEKLNIVSLHNSPVLTYRVREKGLLRPPAIPTLFGYDI